MSYYSRQYLRKRKLPLLQESERIYFNVDYASKQFAQYAHCGFDTERKLWFTGIHNSNLYTLVCLYGINDTTSDEMKRLVQEKLKGWVYKF